MFLLSLGVCVFFAVYATGTQNLYKLVPEHCEINHINESLVHFHFKQCRKFNRTHLEINGNFSIKFNIPSDDIGQLKITGYQFRSNEYRKGPIEFMLGLCTALNSSEYDLPHLLANSNMKCPLSKNKIYYVYHMAPNATNMPPLIPEGRWKFEFQLLYLNKYLITTIEWYTGIEYPISFQ